MQFLDQLRSEVDSTVEITNTDSILHCFTDGSSSYPQDPDLRRGTWAAAYWDTNTRTLWYWALKEWWAACRGPTVPNSMQRVDVQMGTRKYT